MTQQIIALLFILLFVLRLYQQRKKKQINGNEFLFWLSFWSLGAIAIIFIKQLDSLLAQLGFSSGGINFLLYLSVLSLFYFIFKLRLKINKLEKNLTDLVREIALKK